MEGLNRWQADVAGTLLCSMKTGGHIKWVSRPTTKQELQEDLAKAGEMGIPWRILGGGSNTVLPDDGFAGLIIIPNNKELEVLQDVSFTEPPLPLANERYRREEGKGFLELNEKPIEGGEPIFVRMGAGVPWGQAVMWTFEQQAVGLQWFARIPCAVGGAVYNNIHGEQHFLSEVVQQVTALRNDGSEVVRLPSELSFGYDESIFHISREEVIWEVVFKLKKASEKTVESAKEQYLSWTRAKTEKQPSGANSGSVFMNLDPSEPLVEETGMVAAGWYIDHAGCKGFSEGGMQVYAGHANFIINTGGGTQYDFVQLVQRIRKTVHDAYGIWLMPEVVCMLPDGTDTQW